MAYGGGRYVTQNKKLPGTYTKFVSKSKASATLSDRGYLAVAMEFDWAPSGVFTVEASEFFKNSMELFGYDYTSSKLLGLRELFKGARTAYLYCLNSGDKAENTYATAAKAGVRGNDIKIVITTNVDDETLYDVATKIKIEDTTTYKTVDSQTVSAMSDLQDNAYVVWKRNATLTVESSDLVGGTNADAVTTSEHQTFLDAIEVYSFNILACASTTSGVVDLYTQYTRRMREEVGVNFQLVTYRKAADYEGVISVENTVTNTGVDAAALVYWVAGKSAGCPVNKSLLNSIYDGELTISTDYTQTELTTSIESGKFMFHKVGNTVRVLDDINTFVSFTAEKSEDFGSNQTVRVLDQEGNDVAALFNSKYLGHVPNDNPGRMSLWEDIVQYNAQLEKIRAITNYDDALTVISQGSNRGAVELSLALQPVNAMRQLYANFTVS